MGTTVLEHVFDWRSWKVAKSFKDSIGFGTVPMEMVLKNTSLGSGRPVIPYVKRIASPGSMHDTGCSGLVRWDDPEGWYGDRGGRGVQDGEHVYTVADSCLCMAKPTQYCKVISLQLK